MLIIHSLVGAIMIVLTTSVILISNRTTSHRFVVVPKWRFIVTGWWWQFVVTGWRLVRATTWLIVVTGLRLVGATPLVIWMISMFSMLMFSMLIFSILIFVKKGSSSARWKGSCWRWNHHWGCYQEGRGGNGLNCNTGGVNCNSISSTRPINLRNEKEETTVRDK
jgi:hypothetical protein